MKQGNKHSSLLEKLASAAASTETKKEVSFDETILEALKKGKTEEAIIKFMGDYVLERFNAKLDEYDLASNVKGYIFYYNKKGLI